MCVHFSWHTLRPSESIQNFRGSLLILPMPQSITLLISVYHVPSTVLGRKVLMRSTTHGFCPCGAYSLVGKIIYSWANAAKKFRVLYVVFQLLSCFWLFVTPWDCITPGLPVFLCLLELAQIHVHWVMILSNHLIRI